MTQMIMASMDSALEHENICQPLDEKQVSYDEKLGQFINIAHPLVS